MQWPDDQAYNEAIQDPRLCFCDTELRSGMVATLPTGLPKVISGNFASVYKIECPQRTWAVRCFRREITDQQSRYAAIEDHLRKSRLPYFVGFQFLRDGIRVGGRWLPILKMEWTAGLSIDQYVMRNIDRPDILLQLSRDWLAMTQALQRVQVAHGDLQNGNVLVVGNALKLIDYDGMYVPALAGRPSNERGHPDFQHPARSDADFGPQLDAFSAWVVFSSLLALSVAPYLWDMLAAGGDKLLFGRADFADPGSSPAFTALRTSGSAHLERLADELAGSLRGSARAVRPLDALYVPREQIVPVGQLPDWLQGQVSTPAIADAGVVDEETSRREHHGAEWLIDHLVESSSLAPAAYGTGFFIERLFVALIALTVAAGGVGATLGSVSLSLAVGAGAGGFLLALFVVVCRYRGLAVVLQRAVSAGALRTARQHEREARNAVEQAGRKLASHTAEYRKQVSTVETKLRVTREQGVSKIAAIQRDANQSTTKLAEQRRQLAERQSAEIRSAEAHRNSVVGSLTSEFNGIQGAEQSERARALQAVQTHHVTCYLVRQRYISFNSVSARFLRLR